MSIMTEEEMDYQIELNELYSNKNDSVENLYEFTEGELSVHDTKTIKDFAEWLTHNFVYTHGIGFSRLSFSRIYTIDEVIAEYEKEEGKNEQNKTDILSPSF